MKINKFITTALAAVTFGGAVQTASAENPNFNSGDLVLYFQQENDTDTVYVSLGNSSTLYRGAATGPDAANRLNFININSALTTAFGSGWQSLTNLYAGVAGVIGTSNTSVVLTNQDPQRTLYVGSARNSAGTVGTANSTAYDFSIAGNGALTTAASAINAFSLPFDDATNANGYTTAIVVSPTSVSQIDEANPFFSPGVQGNAFNNSFAGGVQQVGSSSTLITDFEGTDANVEFALDLYRLQGRNNVTGQVGFGEPLRVGTFEGTVTIDNAGDVSFVTTAVPEPSTYAFLAIGALGLVAAARRRFIKA